MAQTTPREPLFHITKREALGRRKRWPIRILAIVIALIISAIITTIVTGENPISVYVSMFEGAFSTERKTWITLQDLSILLIISLALTPAFKMQFWNIGGEGQVLMGALAASACMICLGDKLPNAVVILLMLTTSLLAGALWGFIPALFKALWNTNETLATLMMNYIATQLVAFFTIKWEVPKGSGKIGIINQDSMAGWLPEIGNKYLLTIIIAVLVTAFVYIYQKYTKHGYEIAVVGESVSTAKYVGISVKKVIIRTMILSGAICGLAGFILSGAINHTLSTTLVNGQGFTGVMVSWLGKFDPIRMVVTSFLLVFLDRGASEISMTCGLNESFADIITGILLFFIIGCEFFIRYRISFRKASSKEVK